jgi:pimeloyl-ACP methyl ester carboxylesterase
MPTFDLPDDRKLAYREEGSGPPLVLVHGSPGDGRSWGRVSPYLRDRFRMLAVDLPGYGGSDGVPDEPVGRAALIGAAIARFAESVGSPVRVAGHSFGGVVALQAALQTTHGAIESLILFEPVYFRALQILGERTVLAPAAAYFEAYVSRALAGEAGAVQLMVDYWFGDGAFARMPAPVRAYLDANAPLNALDVRSTFNDIATRQQLEALVPPVRIVCGNRSPEVVRAIGRGLVQLLPNARLEALAGANHGMLDSHPEAVARLIAG